MTGRPLVSVVVIFRNGEPFLEEAIQGVLAQTYPEWELLLVDDGSDDGSTARAQRHAMSRPDQIRYLEHEGHRNHGMSASRNLGIREARGTYLALLDADDVWLPEKLEEQVDCLERHPQAAMTYGASLYWYSWSDTGANRRRDVVQPHHIPADILYVPPRLVSHYVRGTAAVPCPSSVLVRTAAARAVGGFDEVFRGLYEDQVFFAKICLRHPVFVASACRERYRQHAASASASGSRQAHLQARAGFLAWLAAYVEQQAIEDAELRGIIRLEHRLTSWPRAARILDGLRVKIRRWRQRTASRSQR